MSMPGRKQKPQRFGTSFRVTYSTRSTSSMRGSSSMRAIPRSSFASKAARRMSVYDAMRNLREQKRRATEIEKSRECILWSRVHKLDKRHVTLHPPCREQIEYESMCEGEDDPNVDRKTANILNLGEEDMGDPPEVVEKMTASLWDAMKCASYGKWVVMKYLYTGEVPEDPKPPEDLLKSTLNESSVSIPDILRQTTDLGRVQKVTFVDRALSGNEYKAFKSVDNDEDETESEDEDNPKSYRTAGTADEDSMDEKEVVEDEKAADIDMGPDLSKLELKSTGTDLRKQTKSVMKKPEVKGVKFGGVVANKPKPKKGGVRFVDDDEVKEEVTVKKTEAKWGGGKSFAEKLEVHKEIGSDGRKWEAKNWDFKRRKVAVGLNLLNKIPIDKCRQRLRQELKTISKARVEMIWRLGNALQEIRIGQRHHNLALAIECYNILLLHCAETHRSYKAIDNSKSMAVVALNTLYTTQRSDLINVGENLANIKPIRGDGKNVIDPIDVLPSFNIRKKQKRTKSRKRTVQPKSGFLHRFFNRKEQLSLNDSKSKSDIKHERSNADSEDLLLSEKNNDGKGDLALTIRNIGTISTTHKFEDIPSHPDMSKTTPREWTAFEGKTRGSRGARIANAKSNPLLKRVKSNSIEDGRSETIGDQKENSLILRNEESSVTMTQFQDHIKNTDNMERSETMRSTTKSRNENSEAPNHELASEITAAKAPNFSEMARSEMGQSFISGKSTSGGDEQSTLLPTSGRRQDKLLKPRTPPALEVKRSKPFLRRHTTGLDTPKQNTDNLGTTPRTDGPFKFSSTSNGGIQKGNHHNRSHSELSTEPLMGNDRETPRDHVIGINN